MSDFKVPNEHQRNLMERNGITAPSVVVILENDRILSLKNHDTGDEVTICKGERTRREEQHGNY